MKNKGPRGPAAKMMRGMQDSQYQRALALEQFKQRRLQMALAFAKRKRGAA